MHGEVTVHCGWSPCKNHLVITGPSQSMDRDSRGSRLRCADDGAQTESRLRPLERLALITARPPRVFILARNPWTRARRILDA